MLPLSGKNLSSSVLYGSRKIIVFGALIIETFHRKHFSKKKVMWEEESRDV